MATYFDVNEGDELLEVAPESEGELLSWRQDPSTSHSDWTMVVDTGTNALPQTYHVHKALLSVGPRSCEYFSTLFNTNAEVAEKRDNTSHITLDERDAAVMPSMLDFIYSPTGDLVATKENVIALRSLARYFRCRELMKKANEFIQEDLTCETAVAYLKTAAEREAKRCSSQQGISLLTIIATWI